MKIDDFNKIYSALHSATEYHEFRDRINASVHLAKETIFAPLTSELMAAARRAKDILLAHEKGGDGPEI